MIIGESKEMSLNREIYGHFRRSIISERNVSVVKKTRLFIRMSIWNNVRLSILMSVKINVDNEYR
jgi:hypothetical protein